jgi:hypothetical protein
MIRHLFAVAAVIAFLSSSSADDVPQAHGTPPRLLIASGLDADGNLIVSATEQRQKKVAREVEMDGKKTTRERLPRCHGEVAMADAIIALTSNLAMKGREVQVAGSGEKVRVNRIEFSDAWFDAASKDVPDSDTKPKMPVE